MTICRAGAASTEVYVLFSGAAVVLHEVPGRGEVVGRLLGAPCLFGDAEALLGLPYSGRVVAGGDAAIASISRAAYRSFLDRCPRAMVASMRHLAALGCVSARYAAQNEAGGLPPRVANLLIEYADAFGCGGDIIVARRWTTPSRMAFDLGVPARPVARCLADFEARSWIHSDERGLTIGRRSALEHLSAPIRGGFFYRLGRVPAGSPMAAAG